MVENTRNMHPAYRHLGGRSVIRTISENGLLEKHGIFQESYQFRESSEPGRPALDFIEPLYETNPQIESLAKGQQRRERIHPENPILSVHMGLEHRLLEYKGTEDGVHVFEGVLEYKQGYFMHDGIPHLYNLYKEALRSAGFPITQGQTRTQSPSA